MKVRWRWRVGRRGCWERAEEGQSRLREIAQEGSSRREERLVIRAMVMSLDGCWLKSVW